MAKKVLLVLLLLCFLGSSNLWAWEYPEWQGTLIGAGIMFIALPWIFDSTDTVTNALCYTGGGLLIGGGLLWMILDILSEDSGSSGGRGGDSMDVEDFSSKKINPIIKHLSIGVLPNKLFIGANFQF